MLAPAHVSDRAAAYRPTLALLWLSYFSCYMGRTNLAVALPVLVATYALPYTSAGLLTMASYALYALGQMVNGSLVDRFGAKRLLLVGLVCASLCNVAFGSSSSLAAMVLFWGLNGYVQAAAWPAIVTIAGAIVSRPRLGRVMGVLSTSYQLGSVASWAVASALVVGVGWRAAFWLPAALLAVVAVAVGIGLRTHRETPLATQPTRVAASLDGAQFATPPEPGAEAQNGERVAPPQHHDADPTPFRTLLRDRRIRDAALALCFVNVVQTGFLAWTPAYLAAAGLGMGDVGRRALLFPLAGVVGITLAGRLFDRFTRRASQPLLGVMVGVLTLLLGVFALLSPSSWLSAALLPLVGAVVAAANFLLTGPIAMELGSAGRGGSTIGLINGVGYVGSAGSALVTGWLVSVSGWSVALWFWAVCAAIACGVSWRLSYRPHGPVALTPRDAG